MQKRRKRKNTEVKGTMKREELNKLTDKIINIAIDVHKYLGPGFIERVYEKALAIEFKERGIKYTRQKEIEVKYRSNILLGKQRIDFLVEDEVIVELKVTSEIIGFMKAQIFSYLKTTDKRVGLILNFAKPVLEIKRVVNKF